MISLINTGYLYRVILRNQKVRPVSLETMNSEQQQEHIEQQNVMATPQQIGRRTGADSIVGALASAQQVNQRLQMSTAGANRRSRWDSPIGRPQGTGSGIGNLNNQPAMSLSGDQLSQLINAISAKNVYQNNDRFHDGKKVNVRGGVDRVLQDQVPKDLKSRSTWIKCAEVALQTND